MMRSLVALVLSCLLLAGCVDSRRGGAPTTDGDSGTRTRSTTAPPGDVAITVTGAAWLYDGELVVGVSLANGSGAEPAPQDPTLFSLETDEGAVVSHVFGETTCSAALSVAADASLECVLSFSPPPGHQPTRLHYRAPDGRSASAPIATCSSSSPDGLCPVGTACDRGACAAPCSPSNPSGPCSGPEEICVDGYCEGPCSPASPEGFCEVGACFDGACDASCRVFDTGAPDCAPCLEHLASSGVCGGGEDTCYDATECGNCIAYGTPTCECYATLACSGCETQMRGFVDCIARECPSCVR